MEIFFSERTEEAFRKQALEAGFCLDDPNATIGGTFIDPNYEFIQISIINCPIYELSCASDEETEDSSMKMATN